MIRFSSPPGDRAWILLAGNVPGTIAAFIVHVRGGDHEWLWIAMVALVSVAAAFQVTIGRGAPAGQSLFPASWTDPKRLRVRATQEAMLASIVMFDAAIVFNLYWYFVLVAAILGPLARVLVGYLNWKVDRTRFLESGFRW